MIRTKTIQTEEVKTPGPWSKYNCDDCDTTVDHINRVTYGIKYKVFGVQWFREEGSNDVCPMCGSLVEYKGADIEPDNIEKERQLARQTSKRMRING